MLCLSIQGIVASRDIRHPFIRPKVSSTSTTQSSPSSTTAAPWHSESYLSKKDWDNLRRYQRMPPTIFAPGGRLHAVEQVMDALGSNEDPTSNLVIALHCKDGIVVLSTVSTPPNAAGMLLPTPDKQQNTTNTTQSDAKTNATIKTEQVPLWLDYPSSMCEEGSTEESDSPWSYSSSSIVRIPFQENENLFAISAGNAVHSQILRHLIRNLAESIYVANDDGLYKPTTSSTAQLQRKCPSVAVLARRLADQFQKPTQSVGGNSGRMLVVGLIIRIFFLLNICVTWSSMPSTFLL